MAYAISAWFDVETEQIIRALWHDLEASGLSTGLTDGRHRPHVTLALFDTLDVTRATVALTRLCQRTDPFVAHLAYPGLFPRTVPSSEPPTFALFLALTVTNSLLSLHRAIHDSLEQHGLEPSPFYLPDQWHPHCTIAMSITEGQLARALAICPTQLLPWRGVVDRLGVIETPAEIELHSIRFRSNDG